MTDSTPSLRDPRQTAEHYQGRLDARDIEAEIAGAHDGIAMALEIDEPALTASITQGVRVLSQRLSIRYALGVAVADLADDVRTIGALWADLNSTVGHRWHDPAWARSLPSMTRNAESALIAVHAVSWAVALDERDVVEQIASTFSVQEAKLPVIGHLARMVGVDAPVDGKPSHVKLWQPWLDFVGADAADRQAAFDRFVTEYPKGLKGVRRLVPPTDTGYPGQFAFEAAPLAIHFDLDDSAVRELPDYPTDLVDYGRSQR